jgi:phenylacetate-coenzyme A ligase PaaK-like adenylate-forming protein
VSTDHLPDAIVGTVESAWGCTVYDHYGMTEMGLGGGVECAVRDGYHLREADMLYEVIDPHSGQPVPEGEAGEVVFTTLTRVGMPFVRYRTGDISRFLPGRCGCGSEVRRLERVRARRDGRIHLSGGRVTMAMLDEALFALHWVLDFAAAVAEGDVLELGIRNAGAWRPDMVRAAVTAALGRHVELRIHRVDHLSLRPGKRRISDLRT